MQLPQLIPHASLPADLSFSSRPQPCGRECTVDEPVAGPIAEGVTVQQSNSIAADAALIHLWMA